MANNNNESKKLGRTALASTVAFLFPTLILTGYLWLSRTYDWNWHSGTLDYFALAASIAIGLIGVFLLPLRRVGRFALAAIYVPIAGFLLFLWMFAFVCDAIGSCL